METDVPEWQCLVEESRVGGLLHFGEEAGLQGLQEVVCLGSTVHSDIPI